MSVFSFLSGLVLVLGVVETAVVAGVPLLGHAHGEAVMLVRAEGEVFAVAANCSHYGGPLAQGLVVGGTVRCPWHHACFELKTGAVRGAPAFNPIACFHVEKTGLRLRVGARLSPPPTPAGGVSSSFFVFVGAGVAGLFVAVL